LGNGQTGARTLVQHRKDFDPETFALINPIPNLSNTDAQFYQMGEEGNNDEAYELQITSNMKRLIYRDFIISNQYPNNIVLTKDSKVCVVDDCCYDEDNNSFMISVAPFKKQGDFFVGKPCNSSDFNIYQVTDGIEYNKLCRVHSSEVINQFVCLLYDKHSTPTASSMAAPASFNKTSAKYVCTPLMHAQHHQSL
jgi:hypothetical protein